MTDIRDHFKRLVRDLLDAKMHPDDIRVMFEAAINPPPLPPEPTGHQAIVTVRVPHGETRTGLRVFIRGAGIGGENWIALQPAVAMSIRDQGWLSWRDICDLGTPQVMISADDFVTMATR